MTRINNLFDYILSSPFHVWSKAHRQYRVLYRRYLDICKIENKYASSGMFNPNWKKLSEEKYNLNIKLEKLKSVLSSTSRNKARVDQKYILFKHYNFKNKIDKF